jgi:hypothetical protein
LTVTKVSILTSLAPSLTLDLKVTGSGFGIGMGDGSIEAGESGCCELIAAGSAGLPPQAASVVASKTAPAAPHNLRILLVGISIPMSDSLNKPTE